MAADWREQLAADLADRDATAQRRCLRELRPSPFGGPWMVDPASGRSWLQMAGNDYLALAQHPRLKAAACEAVHAYGTGSGASRLVTGHLSPHAEAERRFAAFKHAEAALLCPTGFTANLAVLTTLAGPGDLICLDKLCHASLVDAARASGATLRVFPHRQPGKLTRLLSRHATQPIAGQGRPPRRFIVTDSVFSMDGDVADLPTLCNLADEHGAILVVDEAHGTGVLGEGGGGLCEAMGLNERVDVVVSTASKALGGLGGVVTGPQVLIDTLVNAARSFIYTTAVPPSQAAVLIAALDVLREEPWRRQKVTKISHRFAVEVQALGYTVAGREIGSPAEAIPTPIVPVVVGDSQAALDLAGHLGRIGILAPAIRPPTVPRGSARVRLTLRSDLDDADVQRVLDALATWPGRPAVRAAAAT